MGDPYSAQFLCVFCLLPGSPRCEQITYIATTMDKSIWPVPVIVVVLLLLLLVLFPGAVSGLKGHASWHTSCSANVGTHSESFCLLIPVWPSSLVHPCLNLLLREQRLALASYPHHYHGFIHNLVPPQTSYQIQQKPIATLVPAKLQKFHNN